MSQDKLQLTKKTFDRVNRGNPEKVLKACEFWQLQICNRMWIIVKRHTPGRNCGKYKFKESNGDKGARAIMGTMESEF